MHIDRVRRRPLCAATALLGIAALTGALAVVPATAASAGEPQAVGRSSVVIGLTTGTADASAVVARLDDQPGVTVLAHRAVEGLAAITVDVPAAEREAALAALRADPAVRYAEPDALASAAGAVAATDPLRSDQVALDKHRIQSAWQWTTGSPDVTVAVVDTGVSPVRDLDDGRLLPGRDFVDDDADAADVDGHGTMVAGVIAAAAGNGINGAGICWTCRILPVRVLAPAAAPDEPATGSYSDVAAGIVWAAEHGADVITLSLAGTEDGRILRDAVQHAHAAGAVVVAAAGNGSSTRRFYPAGIDEVIAVGATNRNDQPMYSSNRDSAADPWIDLVTLGEALAGDHKGLDFLTGTSASASIVAGATALARSLRPSATPGEVAAALVGGADPLTTWAAARRLDAGAVAAAWGEPDGVAPTVASTGLDAGQLHCACLRDVVPTVDDNRDVSRVELVVGGQVVATDDARPWLLSWRPTGPDGAVTATVRAHDDSGNVGEASTTVELDSTSPAAQLLSPTDGGEVGRVMPITIASTSPDVVKIEWNGVTVQTGGRPGPWTLRADLTGNPDGMFQIVAYVHDRAGNRTRVRRTVWLDTVNPVITLNPKEFPKVFGHTAFFKPTVTDLSSSRMELLVNGKVVSRDAVAPHWLGWANVHRHTGTYRLIFRAIDGVGLSSEVTRTIKVDNTAPKVTRFAPAQDAWVRRTFTATATGVSDSSGIDRLKLYVNGKHHGADTTSPYGVPVKLSQQDGAATLRWVVVDKIGNETSIERYVQVDTKVPTVKITKGPGNGARVRGTAALSVSAFDETGNVSRVELLVNGKVVAKDTTRGYRLSVNTAKQKKTMKVQVRVYDRAGNVRSTPTRTWTRR